MIISKFDLVFGIWLFCFLFNIVWLQGTSVQNINGIADCKQHNEFLQVEMMVIRIWNMNWYIQNIKQNDMIFATINFNTNGVTMVIGNLIVVGAIDYDWANRNEYNEIIIVYWIFCIIGKIFVCVIWLASCSIVYKCKLILSDN